MVSVDDGLRGKTDFFLDHQDPSDIGDINRLDIMRTFDEMWWLGHSVTAVAV